MTRKRSWLVGALTSIAVTAALLVAIPVSAASAQTLSPGCQQANRPGVDGMYPSAFASGPFFEGERVTVTASMPTSLGNPTTITFRVAGVVVGRTAFPGTLSYTFPAYATLISSVGWAVDSGNVTWTVSCAFARPTSTEQCKDGGWEAFGFKNQGDCVSFVTTGGKNEPGPNVPTP